MIFGTDSARGLTDIFMMAAVTRPLVTVFCGCAAADGGMANEEGRYHGRGNYAN